MEKLNVNAIEPEGATTTLNIGVSGQSVIINDNIKANTLKDSGGNTIFSSNGSGVLSSVNSALGSAKTLLSTQTASGDASVSFTSDIDNTYKEYIFEFINISSSADGNRFQFQGGSSSYDTVATTTTFEAHHKVDIAETGLGYESSTDAAQSTSFLNLVVGTSYNNSDASLSGYLHIFNPSSTTYIKNFYGTNVERTNSVSTPQRVYESFVAGYFNTASAMTRFQFKFNSGTMSGKIKLYGVS